ncbi:UNVERIFIED_CONTAM: hypothetical protein O8I53_13655 [Campylobacter lari]
MYEISLSELLSQMKSFEFILDSNHQNDYFKGINDFFDLKKKQLHSIKLNPARYRFSQEAINNYQR